MKTLATTLLLTAAAVAACSSSGASAAGSGSSAAPSPPASPGGAAGAAGAASPAQQVSEANGVTVTATWVGPSAGGVLDVAMDTHSGSLDGLDLAAATLRNDRGQQIVGASWSAPAGGHHRAGRLAFTGDAAAVVQGAAWVELVLPNVGGVPERVFRWGTGA